uniref:HVA22-like protein n=1 Tax=Corethron hystrix TaxID=216773 RepID=A0A7S1FPY1_9STRA|mmetsp:Transcript_19267/g.43883  ORF Transcript_19267/g.43883 Transcript_19267/m.43883 type:complete len:164 (+) Transcript_19267:178-669(+)
MTFVDYILGPIHYAVIFAYAPFMSFRAINTPTQDDDKQWLTFWIVHSAVRAVETFLEKSYLSEVIPYYQELKWGISTYLAVFGGAAKIYDMFLSPVFSTLEAKFDEADLALLEEKPGAFIQKYGARAYELAVVQAVQNTDKLKKKVSSMTSVKNETGAVKKEE